jgi:hypothetical protein
MAGRGKRVISVRPDGSLSTLAALPRWNESKGWIGGDSHTLYAFTDRLTGKISVQHGGYPQTHVGPNATVRVATRAEAEREWQKPLSPAWKIAPEE